MSSDLSCRLFDYLFSFGLLLISNWFSVNGDFFIIHSFSNLGRIRFLLLIFVIFSLLFIIVFMVFFLIFILLRFRLRLVFLNVSSFLDWGYCSCGCVCGIPMLILNLGFWRFRFLFQGSGVGR